MIVHEVRIIVVDDDPQIAKAIVRTLAQGDIVAESFISPKEAVKVLENQTVDLLITDYMMPEINGLELINVLKRHQRNALAMLITGINDFSLAVSAINEGSIVHFFTKPFNNDELIYNVQQAIGTIKDRRQIEALKTIRLSALDKQGGESLNEVIHQNAIEGLTHLMKAKDEALYEHSIRISKMCRGFGAHIGMAEELLDLLESGALLHDIGKLAIKDQILDKPSKLNDDEYSSMKRHPQVGSELIQKLGIQERIVTCVMQHHEHINGGGYPQGLMGKEILLDARIVAITDAYDALRSERSYKAGYDFETTRQMMFALADKIYDRDLLLQFFEFVETQGV